MRKLIGVALFLMTLTVPARASQEGDLEILLWVALLAIVGFTLYLVPSFIAFNRRHPNRWLILILNIALGGTGIVWLGCLVWAFHAAHIPNDADGSKGGESGLNLASNDVVPVRWAGYPPPLHPSDRVDQLERLKRLFDDGVIDAEQFQKLKSDIFNRA